jgi:ATP-binding cassette subfamily B protein
VSTVTKEPPILIFDDSLSPVDTETDARINAALRQRTQGVTTLVIAHRITSISGADRILVMEDGRIAEIGSPAELLERNGVYRRVPDKQSQMEEEEENGEPLEEKLARLTGKVSAL